MEQVERIIADLSEPDKANVRLELKLLEVATIDYGVYDVLGNSGEIPGTAYSIITQLLMRMRAAKTWRALVEGQWLM